MRRRLFRKDFWLAKLTCSRCYFYHNQGEFLLWKRQKWQNTNLSVCACVWNCNEIEKLINTNMTLYLEQTYLLGLNHPGSWVIYLISIDHFLSSTSLLIARQWVRMRRRTKRLWPIGGSFPSCQCAPIPRLTRTMTTSSLTNQMPQIA